MNKKIRISFIEILKIKALANNSKLGVIIILAPSIGMVGQAQVAKILQNALSNNFYAIIVGYAPPEHQVLDFDGALIKLPWGGFFPRYIRHILRLLVIIYCSLMLKPIAVIGQGTAGGAYARIFKIINSKCKYILSIHESIVASRNDSFQRKLLAKFSFESDAVHFVSHGLMQQFQPLFSQSVFVIPTPSLTD